jgi:ribosome recycling factor
MRRDVATQLEQLKNRLNGYVAMLVYRYANLCVEANPVSLLSVQVKVEDSLKNIEDVAKVAVHETYHFIVVPIFEEDLYAIGQAITKEHPEFKQEVKTFDEYNEKDPEGKYLFYTMPEVNKDRRDAMLEAIKALLDECKEKMGKAQQDCMKQLAVLQADASPAEIEKTTEKVKEIVKHYDDLREQNHDQKKKEIEDAFALYEQKQAAKEAEDQEQQEAAGNPTQMKFEEN